MRFHSLCYKSQKSNTFISQAHTILSHLMDTGSWYDSDDGNVVCSRRCYSGLEYDRFVSYNLPVSRSSSKTPIWRLLWRKIKMQKKYIFDCSNSSMRFSYDPHSYSQNFDQGSFLSDSDDLSRSFSARFAVPSRIFTQNELML
ncbi:hypothetical protein A4A49_11553 [Nicotiana attenuata]|uniref:Uncharacterized protein n=1 Tax=Nicotiana attenuata TaxID=49451 RepID=A0A314L8N0_NICAT|nr:hypothetical protein A4A49_11553 [Nicotiana attenuata]